MPWQLLPVTSSPKGIDLTWVCLVSAVMVLYGKLISSLVHSPLMEAGSPWRWDVLISLTNCQWDYAESFQLVFSSCMKWHLPETQVCVGLTKKAMRSEPQSLILKRERHTEPELLRYLMWKSAAPQTAGISGTARFLQGQRGIFSAMHIETKSSYWQAATAPAAQNDGQSAHAKALHTKTHPHHTPGRSKGRSLLDLCCCQDPKKELGSSKWKVNSSPNFIKNSNISYFSLPGQA